MPASFPDALHLDPPPIELDLFDSGVLDSLAFVELLLRLEQDFGVSVSVDDLELENFRTIERIAAFVEAHAAAPPLRLVHVAGEAVRHQEAVMDARARKQTLRSLSNGMYIVTSAAGPQYGAATVTWLSQASFRPPLVMAAIRPDSNVFKCLAAERRGRRPRARFQPAGHGVPLLLSNARRGRDHQRRTVHAGRDAARRS